MSHTTPLSYYDLFVVPNLRDYLNEPHDVRRGVNASISAFQLADIMYAFYRKNDPSKLKPWPSKKALLIDLRKREPLFFTIQSIATAYKHLYAYTKDWEYDIETTGALVRLVVLSDNIELYTSWASGDVLVTRKDGSQVSLKNALDLVVNKLWPYVLPLEI